MEESAINLSEVFQVLKKRWKLILIFILGATLIASIFTFLVITPEYEVDTKVFVGKEEASKEGYNSSDIQMYQKLLKTYAELIKTEDLVTKAIESSNLEIKPGVVLKNLTVTSIADTQILELKYKSKSPEEAMKVITSLREEFVKLASEIVPNGNIQIIEEATFPSATVSPNKKMNLAIGVVLGFMLGIGVVFILEFLDNTYKGKENLERELKIPVLGVIPNIK